MDTSPESRLVYGSDRGECVVDGVGVFGDCEARWEEGERECLGRGRRDLERGRG